GKTLLKFGAYVTLAGLVIRDVVSEAASLTDGARLAEALGRVGLHLVLLCLGAALAFAVLDQIIARRDFGKKMRMSRREVRREHRDREGDARLKQRRKELHKEFARSSQSLRGVRGADVLITNPTHFAVALRYAPSTMAAPTIVSR